jgi:hypothetical protein
LLFLINLSFEDLCTFLVYGILNLTIQLLFGILCFLVFLFPVLDDLGQFKVFLSVWTHNLILILILSHFHCFVLSNKLIFISCFITHFSFSIHSHIVNVISYQLLICIFAIGLLFIFHHQYLIKFGSILLLLLSLNNLIPFQRFHSFIYSTLFFYLFAAFLLLIY